MNGVASNLEAFSLVTIEEKSKSVEQDFSDKWIVRYKYCLGDGVLVD